MTETEDNNMAKKRAAQTSVPHYPTVTKNGTTYFRTRLTDADGKRFDLYGNTEEELYWKVMEAQR